MSNCIHISIKRWRDKVNGNSYFSGQIFNNGLCIARLPIQYGYGSHPDAVAGSELKAAGIIQDRAVYATSGCVDAGIPCTYDEAWVTKRECKAHGE